MIVMKPTTISSKLSSAFSSLLFCVYICGHQRRRRTASNSVNLFLFSMPTTGIIVTPFFLQLLLNLLFGFSLPFSSCSLFLPMSQPHSIGINQDSAALRSEVPVLIWDMLDRRGTRSAARHDPRTRPEDKLEFSRVSVVLSRSLLLQRVSRYLRHTARSTTTLPSRYTDQTTSQAPLPCVMK